MMKKENFEELKKDYGDVASWAIWKKPEQSDLTSNIGNMEWANDEKLYENVCTKFVFVGLNCNRQGGSNSNNQDNCIDNAWKSFHMVGSNDYKLRYALMNSPYKGSYITDIIKNHPNSNST